jgi:hypothetical protein
VNEQLKKICACSETNPDKKEESKYTAPWLQARMKSQPEIMLAKNGLRKLQKNY